MPTDYFKEIYEHIQDGIIVMTVERQIRMINPAGTILTGWHIGDLVPFCSYCKSCAKQGEEPSCYLICNKEVPSFLSEMPTYHGETIDVEMSTAAIYQNDETGTMEYLLVLRDHETFKKAEQVATTKKMIRALIEARESEHKRLAQELHDGVGQSLFSISVALQAVETFISDNQKLTTYIGEVRQELQKVMKDVSDYSHQLRPYIIDQLGLVAAVDTLIESVTKNMPELHIALFAEKMKRVDAAIEINLYRLIQEALHNITKYARATDVQIHLEQTATHIYATITDNGIGFERAALLNEGLGLLHMEERIEQVGGTCNILSKLGEGTSIDIVIPNWEEE